LAEVAQAVHSGEILILAYPVAFRNSTPSRLPVVAAAAPATLAAPAWGACDAFVHRRPAESAAGVIPQADVVAITGTALINHTLDGLLALCRPDALVMVLGPSTPLSPVLFEHGATIISGARVVDEAAVMRTVAQGATFQQVEGVRLLTLQQPKQNRG
jgi:hypothetical protein